jgi:Ser/Thr protein kinase RdoA (MazF antagonist)
MIRMAAEAAQAVLSYYFPRPAMVRRIEPLGNAGGWSGSRLWLVSGDLPGRSATPDFCLRRWPRQHPNPQQLQFIHAVLRDVVRGLPAVAVPVPTLTGATYVENAGHFWELATWRPGRADYCEAPSGARLRAALHTLARFHELATRVVPGPRRGVPPALLDRQRKWADYGGEAAIAIGQALRHPLGNEIDACAAELFPLAQLVHRSRNIEARLRVLPELVLQPAIRDVHHDHVLFSGDEVTGLIDFGALRQDTPLADVARLVGSLAGDDRPAREFALQSYAELRPLSESEVGLVNLLDESGLVLSGFLWLTWLYVERRDMGPTPPIARRLREILGRLRSCASIDAV